MPTAKQTRACPTCHRGIYFNKPDNGYVCGRDGLRWRVGNTWTTT